MPVRKSQNWLPGSFNDFFGIEWLEKANGTAPAINIIENEDEYKVELAAPGMTKDDFTVRIDEDNQLLVSIEKKTEREENQKQGRYLRREFSYTQFQQTMILPDNVDREKITAKVEHGVLTVDIPKKKPEEIKKSVKNIEIKYSPVQVETRWFIETKPPRFLGLSPARPLPYFSGQGARNR